MADIQIITDVPLFTNEQNQNNKKLIVLSPSSLPFDDNPIKGSHNLVDSNTIYTLSGILNTNIKTNATNIKTNTNNIKTNTNNIKTLNEKVSKLVGFPDYNKGVAYTASNYFGYNKANKFTIPRDGWLFIRCGGDEIVPKYYINGYDNNSFSHAVAMYGTGHANHSSIFIPVKKNNFFTCSIWWAVQNIIIYPML